MSSQKEHRWEMLGFSVKNCPVCGGPPHGPVNVDGKIDDRYLFRTRPAHRNGYQYPWVVFVGCANPERGVLVAQVHNEYEDPMKREAVQKAVDTWNGLSVGRPA